MRGVRRTRVGYTGGTTTNPTYNAVCRGSTGHSEALRIVFDPSVISFEELLKAFFSMHAYQYKSKPQYMSAIFVQGDAQRTAAENFVAKLEQRGDVATRILSAAQWYDAEEYHQCYHEKNRAMW
jgi:peptide-methionine (S)-S-oxide reductase